MTILFIIFTIISATIDAELYNSGYRFTDHTSRFLLRALVVVTLEYTTSGTPTVTADIRRSAVAMETNISTSDDSRKVMTIHTTMVVTGGSGDYATVYLKVSGSAITLQKCRLTVIPLGIVRV
jgi:hypothetical protein